MGPNEKQKIEIEKLHRDPLPPLNQAVTADYSDFLGTALFHDVLTPAAVVVKLTVKIQAHQH